MSIRTYIINKTKVLLPQEKVALADFGLLFSSFRFIGPKTLQIIWPCNLSIFCVPDKVYSRNAQCVLILISTFLSFTYIQLVHEFIYNLCIMRIYIEFVCNESLYIICV